MAEDKKQPQFLSKSRLMRGLQCAKSLHLTLHHPELEPAVSACQQALFDQGKEIGSRAQAQFPGGVLIKAPHYDTAAAVQETRVAIVNGASTIFEAAFEHEGVSARVDILQREDVGQAWKLIEVKSATSVKPEHLDDVGIQAHVLERTGNPLSSCSVMYINNSAVAPDLGNLLIEKNVTAEIAAEKERLSAAIDSLKKVAATIDAPKKKIGPHCHAPYDCPFISHCWKDVPSPSVFEFPGLGSKKWEFYERGIVSLNDRKLGPFTGAKAERLDAVRKGVRWIDVDGISAMVKSWVWPVLYLDFETINFAIPRYAGTRPYEQVPFQFSALMQDVPRGAVTHVEFLHQSGSDPRQPLVEALVKVLAIGKSIVAYNKGFEAARMKRLAEQFPEHAPVLLAACERMVDPLPIFRNHVYDAGFKGSFSIKSVAPAILGEAASYEGMPIPDGGAAQRAYVEIVSPNLESRRQTELRDAMLAYCKKDTEVMVQLVDWLMGEIGSREAA